MMYMYAHHFRKMVKKKRKKVKVKVKINCIVRFDQVGHYLI